MSTAAPFPADILSDRGTQHRMAGPTKPQLGIEPRKPRGRADVGPAAGVALTGEPAGAHRRVEQWLQRKDPGRASVEQPRIEHRNTGIGQAAPERQHKATAVESVI